MSKMRKIIILFFMLFWFGLSYSQGRKIGLSATLQDNQFGINVPVWLTQQFVLAPAFDLRYVEGVATETGIAIAPRFYMNNKQVSPYLGFRLGAFFTNPAASESYNNKIDMLIGAAFGGEYFIANNFSAAIEAQGNFIQSDPGSESFGNQGRISFNTATAVSATIYF